MGQNISAFRGAYDFLSNFYPAPITYNGLVFKTTRRRSRLQNAQSAGPSFAA